MRVSQVVCAVLVAAIFLCVVEAAGRDFYKILGVSRGATKKEIKKAYRKLAIQYHPDKNPGDEAAAAKFQDIGAAYEVLSDDEQRKVYDRHGEEGLKNNKQGGHDPFDVFGGMFGFNFGGQRRGEPDTPRGADVHIPLDVTLEHLYNGEFREIMHAKAVAKEVPGKRKCNCRVEMRTQQVRPGQFTMSNVQVCDECPNVKMVMDHVELDVEVEPGMVDGQEIRFSAEGEPHIDGEPGDLIFHIRAAPHKSFHRIGHNLFTNVTISLRDSLVGFTTEIKHLDGHMVKLSRTGMTPPNTIEKVSGQGMMHFDNNHEMGDLYVTYQVEYPNVQFSQDDMESLVEILRQDSKQTVFNGFEARFVPK
eukprot:m.357264 g.357264  ORF g.357264 m.357264 type:complete len:362 (+) comp17754_c0_seq1:279-1364(+)